MSSKDKKENEKEKEKENDKTLMLSKDENEKQNRLLNNDNNANPINKKDENEYILLEYMVDVDDKLFKNIVTVKILTGL